MARVWFLLTLLASCAPDETELSNDSAPVFAHDDGTVQVGEAGLAVEGEEGSRIWLRTDRIGRDGLLQDQGNAAARAADCGPAGPRLWPASCGPTFERDLPLATERWTLQNNGIQQSWTLWERPEGEGPLWIDVKVEGATPAQTGPDVALWTPEGGLWTYAGLKAWDANDRLLSAQMEAEDGYIRIQVDDAEAAWPITIDPVLSTASTTLTQTATDFGIGVGSGGDVNRDGYDDVIVGARFGTGLYGEAFSYHGSSTGVSTSYSRMWRGADYYGKFGEYVDNGGDINGDNYDDALVCEFYSERFFVYNGSSTGLASSATTTITGVYGLGRDLHIIGDWNNDGYDDVVVGSQEPNVTFYRGSSTGLVTTAVTAVTTSSGPSVAPAGDVNNDGYDDVIYGDGTANRAYVVRGASSFPGTTTTLSRTSSVSFGYDVHGGGDINGDGYDDVIVGDPGYSSNTGRVVVYYGSSSGITTSNYATLSAPTTGTGFGATVLVAGDLNGDGYDDVAVSDDYNYSALYVFHGSSSGLVSTPVNTLNIGNANFGYSLSSGDVNNDGYRDLVAGTIGSTAYVYHGCPDTDGDGYCTDRDCNDNAAAINPAATETCDSVDNDCDGLIDDADTNVSGRSTFYRDLDGDSYGNSSSTTSACSRPTGYASNSTDCNDSSAAINPAATESCDSVDNDCDGLTDDADTNVSGRSTFYRDADADTYGTATTTTAACTRPTGYVTNSTDCNDGSSAISPAATEICDSVDNDCDSLIDDADSSVTGRSTYYRDNDSDGYGSSSTTTTACSRPTGYATSSTDCNDSSAAINPGATETCDSVDNDCDSLIDDADSSVTGRGTYYRDGDGDGYGSASTTTAACSQPTGYVSSATDCNDGTAAVNPAATESCDSIDNDCDSLIDDADTNVSGRSSFYQDADRDGYGNATLSTQACVQPNGYVSSTTDCDDTSATVNPAGTETCDSIDNDCDGLVDDSDTSITGQTIWYADADGDSFGGATALAACTQPGGFAASSTDCDDSNASIHPAIPETCDGIDNDCDNLIDDADSNVGGQSTWYADNDGDSFGGSASVSACQQPSGYTSSSQDCDDSSAAIHPAIPETCDGIDNDCDSLIDDADSSITGQGVWYQDADGDSFGGPNAVTACSQPSGYAASSADCDDSNAGIHPAIPEICDSIDNNCDGLIDDADSSVTGQSTWYADSDGDGHGGPTTMAACVQPTGYVGASTDCDDSNASVSPDGSEICDGLDNDCDGLLDLEDPSNSGVATWYVDSDGDGFGSTAETQGACSAPEGYVGNADDCDDANKLVNPDGIEICDDADNNCNGLVDDEDPALSEAPTWYEDQDGDGSGDEGSSVVTCDAPEGFVDNATDCNDGDENIHPGVPEVCGGSDENCDGKVDDEDPTLDGSSAQTWYGDEDGDGHGSESKTSLACVAPEGSVEEGQDCDDSDPTVYSGAPELDDGKDNNCDGLVDGEKADGSCGGCSASTDGTQALWLALLPALVLRRRRKA